MDLIERDITLTCVSNDVGGPYVGGARWLGVRLTDLLDRAGVGDTADQILSTDVDGMTISTPLKVATDGRDAMIAIGMNGEALPREHGFPVRMVVPGLYGYVCACKWITRMTLTTYDEQEAYWTERDWATDAPIKISSRIDTPKSFEEIDAGDTFIGGVAWAQDRGIGKVEVQIDGGAWQKAELGPSAGVDYWRQWYLPWQAETGEHTLAVRATSQDGEVQTPGQGDAVPGRRQRLPVDHRPRRRSPAATRSENSRSDQSGRHRFRTPDVPRPPTERFHPMKRTTVLRTSGLAVAALTLSAGLAACGSDEEPTDTGSDDPRRRPRWRRLRRRPRRGHGPGRATSTVAACGEVPTDGDGSFDGMATAPVASAASANPLLTTLVAAVTAAELVEPLNSAEELTVFAPANPAFEAFTKKQLERPARRQGDAHRGADPPRGAGDRSPPTSSTGEFETLNGDMLTINGSGEEATIGDEKATVLCGNIQTANATVYVIDTVMMP